MKFFKNLKQLFKSSLSDEYEEHLHNLFNILVERKQLLIDNGYDGFNVRDEIEQIRLRK